MTLDSDIFMFIHRKVLHNVNIYLLIYLHLESNICHYENFKTKL